MWKEPQLLTSYLCSAASDHLHIQEIAAEALCVGALPHCPQIPGEACWDPHTDYRMHMYDPALLQKVSSGYLECMHVVQNMSCSAVSQRPHLSGYGPQINC